MKKEHKYGFALIETLIVSVFISGVLIYLYVQFGAIQKSYEDSFRFNTVPGLYAVRNLNQYLISQEKPLLTSGFASQVLASEGHYINITDCSFATSTVSKNYCQELLKRHGMKQVLVADENLVDLRSYIKDQHPFSGTLEKFIQKLDVANVQSGYRLIVEFTDGTYASLKLNTKDVTA